MLPTWASLSTAPPSTKARGKSRGKMDHIGKAHFPITVPRKEVRDEVQMWFDQGNALLHSYFQPEGLIN